MTYIAPQSYLTRHRPVFQSEPKVADRFYSSLSDVDKKKRILRELKMQGVSRLGLLKSEVRELPHVLHDDEVIEGIVYGRHQDGFAVLVATDRRVLFVDKKPLYTRADEITYELVGGVSYGRAGLFSTITLHTRLGNYKLRTRNFKTAKRFIDFIELRCLENDQWEQPWKLPTDQA